MCSDFFYQSAAAADTGFSGARERGRGEEDADQTADAEHLGEQLATQV